MRRVLWLLLIAWFGAAACTVNTEATGAGSDADAGASGGVGGNAGSGGGSNTCFPSPTQKFCGKNCPEKDKPEYGCADPSCAACDLPNAATDCSGPNGGCGVLSCNAGYDNCDGNVATGCEVNVDNDPKNCGSCNNDCYSPGDTTSWDCILGSCKVNNCPTPNLHDCNQDPADKCEVDTNTDVKNCGFCGNDCSNNFLHAGAKCVNGTCQMDQCNAGWADCNKNPADGCEQDIATDKTNCGACGKVCNATHGQSSCQGGQCKIACSAGYADCDNNVNNGCEIHVAADITHCGTCTRVCSSNHGTPTCSGGSCSIKCAGGYDDCDGNVGNGCEASLSSNAHCGTCTKTCSNGHGTTQCSGGNCNPSCATLYQDCDGNPDNGCEKSVASDINNCGGCNATCSYAHATPQCSSGSCSIQSCDANYKNCDNNSGNGCEKRVDNDVNNCGSCGNKCSTVNATPSCSGGQCSLSCKGSWGDCDSNVNNGCESDTNNDPANCGGCGQPCNLAHATAGCSGGNCNIASCNNNYDDCNTTASDGCETHLDTDSDCGACNSKCTGGKHCQWQGSGYGCQ